MLGEMLKYRGYEEVSFMCKDHASLVQCMESDAVVALACSGSREDKAVVFHADVHVGVKALRSIVASDSFSLTARIVVSVGGPTSFARRDASESVAHRYCIATPSQWPRFRPSDPMCIFGDFREGDLIEIRRRSASGESMYYRMVS